jgi:thiamine pyrophosphokinase
MPFETSNFSVEKRILGVLGGTDIDDRLFKFWAHESDILVAADGGADLALRHGLVPHVIVGDLDSASPEALASGADVYKFDDQNTTDCDKMLQWVADQGHTHIDVIGVEGDRLDHVLGTLGSCARSPLSIRLVLRDGLGWVLKPGAHTVPATPGQRISILPIGSADDVSIAGLRWSLTSADLRLDGFVSVSNIVEEAPVEVSISEGSLLIIIEQPPAG